MLPKINILFLDDEAPVIKAIKTILTLEQEQFVYINFLYATSNEDALKLFEQHETIHVLVQDNIRHGMHGLEFALHLYKLKFKPIIIYLIGYTEPDRLSRIETEGRCTYVMSKPSDLNLLLAIIKQARLVSIKIMKCFPKLSYYEAVDQLPPLGLFQLYLWLTDLEFKPIKRKIKKTRIKWLPNIKVLLLDDDAATIRTSKQILTYEQETLGNFKNVNFLYATSNDEALQIFEQHKTIDFLLQDYERPGMNGLEFAHYLYKLKYEPVIIYYTGHGNIEFHLHLLKNGLGYYVLEKPTDFHLFLAIIKREQLYYY